MTLEEWYKEASPTAVIEAVTKELCAGGTTAAWTGPVGRTVTAVLTDAHKKRCARAQITADFSVWLQRDGGALPPSDSMWTRFESALDRAIAAAQCTVPVIAESPFKLWLDQDQIEVCATFAEARATLALANALYICVTRAVSAARVNQWNTIEDAEIRFRLNLQLAKTDLTAPQIESWCLVFRSRLQHQQMKILLRPESITPTEVTMTAPTETKSHIPSQNLLKIELNQAAYQVVAGKLTTLTAQAVGALLQRELPNESPETRARIGAFLESSNGEIVTALLLSALAGPLGATIADKIGVSSAQLDMLASALRVHALVHGGNALLDTLFEPALLLLKDTLRGLPSDEASIHLLPEAVKHETVERPVAEKVAK